MSIRRTTLTVLTLVMTLALASVAIAQAPAADKAPEITLVDPLKDFGTVPKGTMLDYDFTIKNTGNADLKILAAKPTCGCTVADFDKEIKPGQTGKVTAHVDTTQFSGPISKAVTLETNDPNTPTAQVTIRAVVKPYVEAFPAGFLRYNILQGDTQAQSLVLYSEESEPFKIVRVEAPGEWVKVDYAPVEKEEERARAGAAGQTQYRVNVTLGGPTAPTGPLAEKVKIVTNSKHQPEYLVSLTGIVRPRYSVMPTVLNFGEVAASDAQAERAITVRSHDPKSAESFKVTKVESKTPGITASVVPSSQPGEFQVTAKVDPSAKAGALDGSILIYTNDQVIPVYTLPLKGTVKVPSASK